MPVAPPPPPGSSAAGSGLDRMAYALARVASQTAGLSSPFVLHHINGSMYRYVPPDSTGGGLPVPGWYTWPANVPVSDPRTTGGA